MENGYKILVIMPMYNAARFINESIPSIINQQNTKLVIIDDCSTDNSYELARKFKSVTIIRNDKNMGTYYSINVGLYNMLEDKSWTHYCIHGADDVSNPNRFKKQMDKFNTELIGVSCISTRIEYYSKKRIRINSTATESQTIYKREVFDNIGYYDHSTRVGGDTEYRLRVALMYNGRTAIVRESLVTGYQHGTNLTQIVKLGGQARKKYVNRFKRKHQWMRRAKKYYNDFTP